MGSESGGSVSNMQEGVVCKAAATPASASPAAYQAGHRGKRQLVKVFRGLRGLKCFETLAGLLSDGTCL